MTIADEVSPPVVCAGVGFDRRKSTAGRGRRAQGARVSLCCQVGRDAPGDHVGDFAGGIVVKRFPFGALKAGQSFYSLGDEDSGEQDLDSCGKRIA